MWRAKDTKLRREVAIKVLPEEFSRDEDHLARFQREARAASALNHPNICIVHDLDEHDGAPFIVMELLRGETLAEKMARESLEISEVLDLGIQLADALDAAHNEGIIHRDIKPANIFVTERGTAKLLDFGLARVQAAGVAGASTVDDVTASGAVLGTVSYMSPEQARGEELDARTDLFSLGVVFYEMTTGRPAFSGNTTPIIFDRLFNKVLDPPTRINPKVPRELDAMIEKLLVKDRNQRSSSASELKAGIDRIKLESASRRGKSRPSEDPDDGKTSIAVLPFANMSADPDQEYFCDGMAEEIINALSHVNGLRVVARTSAFAFKDKQQDVREIGRALDVEHLLEGSVRKVGNQLRITGQLINVSDGYHIWSERYDREFQDVFAIQDEISLAIVDQLKVKLLGDEKEALLKNYTESPEAFASYLKGRHLFQRHSGDQLEKAAEHFREAISLDPKYAKAHAGLAGVLMWDGGVGPVVSVAPQDVHSDVRKAIGAAMKLDDRLSEAHTMMGIARALYEFDWAGSDQAFEQAIGLNPGNPDAYIYRAWHSTIHYGESRREAALADLQSSLGLDPLSRFTQSMTGMVHFCSHQYAEAVRQFRQVLDLEPDYFHSLMHLGETYQLMGMYDDAERTYKRAEQLAGGIGYLDPRFCTLYMAMERPAEAQEHLERLLAASRQKYVPATCVGWAYIGLGQTDEAFTWFEKAYKDRDFYLTCLGLLIWDPVRSDSRYLDLMERIGLR